MEQLFCLFTRDKVDWYIKNDDDTYLIMENYRHVLHQYDPKKVSVLVITFLFWSLCVKFCIAKKRIIPET